MWEPLTNVNTIEIYLNSAEYCEEKEQLARVLELLRKTAYRDLLSVVTSLGHLRLTTALRYEDDRAECPHPSISLSRSPDNKIQVSYFPGGRGKERDKVSAKKQVRTAEEAVAFIGTLMVRMQHDCRFPD